MKLAEALLLRKQLEAKVKQLEPLKIQGEQGVYKLQTKRVNVGENVDEVNLQIPRLSLSDITATYDHYAKQLRIIDGKIQQANWTTEIDFAEEPAPKNV